MGIWNRLFRREVRSEVVSSDNPLFSLLKSVEISPETAMEIPAVSSCIDFISDCIAGLPIRLYRENRQTNSTEEIKDDDRLRLLNDETGDLLDPFQMKKAVVMDFFLYGSGYIYPEMDGNRVLSLRYIPHGAIASLYRGKDPVFKVGQYVLSNGLTLWDDQVIKLLRATKDGLSGQSVVEQHQQILSAMYREIIYEKMLTAAGGNKKGFITTETKLSAEAMEQLHKNWRDMYATTDNTMMILNKGLQFHESSNTSVEMQLNENKVRNNELVCQIFGMSSEAVSGKLGDEAAIATIKNAVIPVVTAFENALDRGLLLPSERDRTYYAFDTSELLKGDILKRYQAYKTGLECNVLQIDEARYKEDLPPLGLNWIKLGLQDVLYDPKTKVIYTPNMNQSMTMTENQVNFGEQGVDNGGDDGIMEERADSGTKIVCVWGSPLSGKTTFVRNHAGKTDVVWDWDMIQQAVSLSDSHQESPPQVLRMLLKLRKAFVRAAADCGAKTAWFICTRPNKYVRDMLGDTAEYIKMDVSKDECYRRLAADESRPDKQKMAVLIEEFFSKEPLEQRDWVTINGKHVFIGEDSGGGSSGNSASESGISGKHESANAQNSVDLEYLKSEDYKNKFKGITGNTKVDEQLYQQSKAILTHRNGTDKEDMCLIDSRTGEIAGRQSNSKVDFGVEYNSSIENAIKNNPRGTLISIHNHSTNNPPTGSDFVSNGSNGYQLGLVVTHNGKVFTYKAGEKPFTAAGFGKQVDKYRGFGYTEYDAIINVLTDFSVQYGIEWSER